MSRLFVIFGALLGLTGVAIGAFGAHGLAPHFEQFPNLEPTFQTAARYHMYHALGLFAAAWVATRWPGRAATWGGILMFAGVLIFSGSLYILSIANIRFMGAIAPIGGTLMILGWGGLALAAWQDKSSVISGQSSEK